MSHAGLQLGHYRLLHQVGGGAMGEIYLAEDTRLPRQVAIKIIRSEASSYPHSEDTKELERLFQREMQAVTRLDHPHILPLFDFGEERIQNMTYMYMVMPYRQAGSLADWKRTHFGEHPLPLAAVERIVYQASLALHLQPIWLCWATAPSGQTIRRCRNCERRGSIRRTSPARRRLPSRCSSERSRTCPTIRLGWRSH